MIYAVDIGNTAVKIARADDKGVYGFERIVLEDLYNHLKLCLEGQYGALPIAISCVGELSAEQKEQIDSLGSIFYITPETRLPFTNLYKSATLGQDRKALAAAVVQHKASSKLVIDIGTCVTYDFLNDGDKYYGGAISPGLNLRYHSLHNYTARLPLLQPQNPIQLLGNTTAGSIHSGIVLGLAREIDGTIDTYRETYGSVSVFITGGDAPLLIKQLKSRFFAAPFLMLQGIHSLYEFNNKK